MIIAFPYVRSRPQFILRKGHGIIRKGDGIYAHLPGESSGHLLRAPPPEAINADPNMPDAPAFAHMGSAKPHSKSEGEGHNGVGELLNMTRREGKYGHAEFVHQFDGKEYLHHHGIDGIIKGVGELMEKLGVDAQDPKTGAKALVQQAIDKFNAREGLDPRHQLPNVDSVEWRKLVAAPYDANYPNQTKTKDGRQITLFTNRGFENSPAGLHIESYANHFHKELDEILADALKLNGYLSSNAPMWIKYPYITPRDLHPSAYRFKGKRFGQGAGPGGTTARAHEDSFPEGAQLEPSIRNIYSWEMLHHLPRAFFMKKAGKGAPPRTAIRLANEHLKHAFENMDPEKVPDIQVPINLNATQEAENGTAPGNYVFRNLRDVMKKAKGVGLDAGDDTELNAMLNELSKSPAFTFMFGRINANNTAGNLLYQFMMDKIEDTEGLDYAQMRPHITRGDHVRLPNGNTLHEHSHDNAAKLMTKLAIAGVDEDGVSILRNATPENPADFRLNPDTDDENLDHRRVALQGVADMLAAGFNQLYPTDKHGNPTHIVQRPLPENIPTQPLYSRNVAGYSETPVHELPSHMFHHTEEHMLPTKKQGSGEPIREEGAPAVKPPESPALQTQTPRQGQVAVQRPFTPQTEERRAARAALGQADPASLRQVMGRMGVPIPAGTGPTLTPQEQQFQQTFGDPRQQLLSQYLRSLDESLPIGDRLMKAMEEMQKDEARMDTSIIKHIPVRSVHINDDNGVNVIAKKLGLTSLDVRTIAHSTGDWGRVSKQLNVPLDVIKVVKVSMGGI